MSAYNQRRKGMSVRSVKKANPKASGSASTTPPTEKKMVLRSMGTIEEWPKISS